MKVDVEAVLNEAGRQGLLVDGGLYSRSVLVEAMVRTGIDSALAAKAFVEVRKAAGEPGGLGALQVVAVGQRRGRRYRFVGLPEPGSPPAQRPRVSPGLAPEEAASAELDVHFGDNLPILSALPDASFDLVYIDPPFNTGKTQTRTRVRTVRDDEGGDRIGFQGQRYRTIEVGTASFADAFADFYDFLEPRLEQAHRLLKPTGAFFLHIDYREVHYCKVLLDHLFGRDAFLNEIIWAYDYGGRSKKRWSSKHDSILWYVKDTRSYTFNFDEMDRIPYMAPGLVGKEKAARGKTPTDVWWHTIVPTNGKERTGYPTQKPLGILDRILKVHSRPGDRILDFFAGSGTTGESALRLGRSCTLIDDNAEAMRVIAKRLAFAEPRFHGWQPRAGATADGASGSGAVDEAPSSAPEQPGLFD